MAHLDDCPNPACDARIEHARSGPSRSYSTGSGDPTNAPDRQQDVCPKCGTKVRRRVGEPWMEATGPGADVS